MGLDGWHVQRERDGWRWPAGVTGWTGTGSNRMDFKHQTMAAPTGLPVLTSGAPPHYRIAPCICVKLPPGDDGRTQRHTTSEAEG